MNQRGELTTKHLVMIIILITSFVIILLLILRLDLGGETAKEICHNSVVLVGKGTGLIGTLDCQTEYICIGNGECEGITASRKVRESDGEKIGKIVEEEIKDCWWMFGEGGVDYLGIGKRGLLSKTTCAICSVIKFSDDVGEVKVNDELIETSEKYSIVTGMKSGKAWGIFSEELFIEAQLIKSSEIDSLNCKEFITKV